LEAESRSEITAEEKHYVDGKNERQGCTLRHTKGLGRERQMGKAGCLEGPTNVKRRRRSR
jgi:hypothetical protein